jgi:hypothetical protein
MKPLSSWERLALDAHETDELDRILRRAPEPDPLELLARRALDVFSTSGCRVSAERLEDRAVALLITTSGAEIVHGTVEPYVSINRVPEDMILGSYDGPRESVMHRCRVVAIDRASLIRLWWIGPNKRNSREFYCGVMPTGVMRELDPATYRDLARRFRSRS